MDVDWKERSMEAEKPHSILHVKKMRLRTDVIYSSPTLLKGEHDIDNPASIHF